MLTENYWKLFETIDISGKEQLSIRLNFFNEKGKEIEEEFCLGFVELRGLKAVSIAKAIGKFNLRPW